MSQYVETPCGSFVCGGAIGQFLRVKTPAALAVAGATDVELGTIEAAAFALNDVRAVRLRTAQGTCKMVAAGAFAAGATLYGAAGGKVDDIDTGNRIGIAFEAATAPNDVVEVMRSPGAYGIGVKSVESHDASHTLTAAESGTVHRNTEVVSLLLPRATVGLEFFFRVGAALELYLNPQVGDTIALPSTGVQGLPTKWLTANAIGETVHLLCDVAGQWSCYGYTGTWTAEI